MAYYSTWTAFPSEPVECGAPGRFEPDDDECDERDERERPEPIADDYWEVS
jgi:hypothetical protein